MALALTANDFKYIKELCTKHVSWVVGATLYIPLGIQQLAPPKTQHGGYRMRGLVRFGVTVGFFGVLMLRVVMLGVGLSAVEPVSIRIQPAFVFAGAAMNIICTVPRHQDNRTLAIGVSDTYQSTRDLPGDRAAVTHRLQVAEIPCEAGYAYCSVYRSGGLEFLAREQIRIVGCDQ